MRLIREAARPKTDYLRVALLFERVAANVIAIHLPEAGLLPGEELHSAYPLGALPEVQVGDDKTDGPAVLFHERLAVVVGGEEVLGPHEVVELEVRRVTAIAVEH